MAERRRRAVHEHIANNGNKNLADLAPVEKTEGKPEIESVSSRGYEDNDIFLRSLEEITPEEIGGEIPKRKKRGSELVSYVIERSVYFFALAVFVVCVIELAATLWEQFSGDIFYSEITNELSMSHLLAGKGTSGVTAMPNVSPSAPYVIGVSKPEPGVVIEDTEKNAMVEELKASITALKQQYPDTYAWIYIEDTKIDYPVVKGEDNAYYLDHAFTGASVAVGSIFADYTLNDYILDNYNTVFYGHNSSAGNMFADVMKFVLDEDFFMTHNIYVYTSTGLYEFEPYNLSMLEYDVRYFRTYFTGADDFVSFIKEMSASPIYKKDLEFDGDDRILTLSTCTKTGIKTKRYCLQAKLIKVTE